MMRKTNSINIEELNGLTNKYAIQFLNETDEKDRKRYFNTVKKIMNIERETGKKVTDWNDDNIIDFFKVFKAKSPASLASKNTIFNKYRFSLYKNMLKEESEFKTYELDRDTKIACSRHDELLSVTINYDEYVQIKNQMIIEEGSVKVNTRDKLIFELAWLPMTNHEIKTLRINDIEFIEGEMWEYAKITLRNNDGTIKRIAIVENEEVVNDIKLVIKEDTYYNFSENSYKCYKFKDTITTFEGNKEITIKNDYLIKPVIVGVMALDGCVSNASITLSGVFNNPNTSPKCKGIRVQNLTIEHIFRSKMLYLMNEGIEVKELAKKYNFKADGTLYGWKNLVSLKYGNNEYKAQ
ncbi:MAG: hypothetical protein ACM3O3_13155 [Syntrophothermus sp.]